MNNNLNICVSIEKMDSDFSNMISKLKKFANVFVVGLDNYSLLDVDILIGKKVSKEILNTANKLKIIFAYKTGVDDFPLEELEKKDIVLCNSHADSTIIAEYAYGLMVSLVNHITLHDFNLRRGIWADKEQPYWESIFNLNVGLLGFGHIGKEINVILKRNNINTFTIDRKKVYSNIELVSDLKELINKCDIIICSLPKTKETNLLFNSNNLYNMSNKYIVNIGRSNIIDEEILYNALKNHYLKGAAIDTWDKKPTNTQEEFKPSKFNFEELNNIILSPHAAMKVKDGHKRYVDDITLAVIEYISEGKMINVVDLKKGY